MNTVARMTAKNTATEIAAEARAITPSEHRLADHYIRLHLQEVSKKTGLNYSRCVENGLYQLVSVTYDKKGNSTVTPHSEFLPFYESKDFIYAFQG